MPFVDPLAVMLIGLAMSTLIGAFYFFFSARGNFEHVRSLVIPAIVVGIFDAISGFEMSFAWPFPGGVAAYNMLFGDPLLLAGLVLIMAGVIGYRDPEHTHWNILPLLILLVGIYTLVGAYSIVQLKLESGNNLVTAMGLYLFDGIGAVLAPIMYLRPTKGASKWLYYLEWIILGVGTVFALVIGYMALNGHLASPP
jgi:putative membrane protein